MEHYSIQATKEAGRYSLENAADPQKPYVTESMEAEMLPCPVINSYST